MSSSFQPEKPYADSQGSGGAGSYLWVAIIAALFVMMLVAFGVGNWIAAIGAGIVTFLVIYLWGARKGRNNQSRAE